MSIFRLALGCVGSLALLCASALARAETLVLLTENLVPFNMAVNGGNYAKNDGISGISTDTVRAACERAQIECQLILRFPWDRVYQQALSEPGYGVFSTARTPEREDKFKWVG
ncbi:amino acid ABC transporter substrate-binding protein, partial [Pseudomonas aeruginosa]|nr:amino acid ABC transporter substrate-binding protein [Pseudomonas aeruginosa]